MALAASVALVLLSLTVLSSFNVQWKTKSTVAVKMGDMFLTVSAKEPGLAAQALISYQDERDLMFDVAAQKMDNISEHEARLVMEQIKEL